MALAIVLNADPSGERVQCDGDAARPRRRRPGLPSHGGGAPRRPGLSCAPTSGRTRAGRRARRPPTGDTEYVDYVLAVRSTTFETIAHIRRHGSGLAEAIVTGTSAAGGDSPSRSRRGGARECLHVVGGWLGVWHGRRDGDLDLQAPRARPGRRARRRRPRSSCGRRHLRGAAQSARGRVRRSFNPIHFGHLPSPTRSSRAGSDRLLLVPAALPPQAGGDLAPAVPASR